MARSIPRSRERVHQARAFLLDSLASLAERAPSDPWIIGQRVRFLVDQGSSRRKRSTWRATARPVRAWCAQLLGFALHAAGDYRGADSAFDAATAAMSPKDRCEWTSAELLLDEDGRKAYGNMNCEQRVAANKKIWWMSTPMFSDSADDRRSEDYARKVLIQLHAALNWDERFDWRQSLRRRSGGRDARAVRMARLLRLRRRLRGAEPRELDVLLRQHAHGDGGISAGPGAPMPLWTAITDPFHASASAWQLNMPKIKESEEAVAQWWPDEHYAPGRGHIAQLRDQTVMLRRDDDVVLATASELRFNNKRIKADTAAAVLIRTTSPDSIEHLQRHAVRNATSLVADGAHSGGTGGRRHGGARAARRDVAAERGSASRRRRRCRRSSPARRRSRIPC